MKLSLLLLLASALALSMAAPWSPRGGARYHTTHSMRRPIDEAETTFEEEDIKEWHFHVYFFQNNNASRNDAMRLRDELIKNVAAGRFICVLNGITSEILPGLDESNIPNVNTTPVGPHPIGSYEVWVPIEYMGQVLSYMMINRGGLTILLHPLSNHAVEDHTGRAMFLGPPLFLDLTVLSETGGDEPQYPELGLGYHGKL